jgi:four helix bundle protein
MAPFDELHAFKKCYDLGLRVYRSTEHWPKREMFGLSAQIRRAATSAALNIAEGVVKKGGRELRRYLDISMGSLAEVQVILRYAKDLEFMSLEENEQLEAHRESASRLTWRLYEAISKSIYDHR